MPPRLFPTAMKRPALLLLTATACFTSCREKPAEVVVTETRPVTLRDTAQKLTEMAHQTCPYSKATRGNIDVTIAVA